MGRWLCFFILLALVVPSVAGAVDLVEGWNLVSFPILETKPLADFDLIDKDTSERKTFEEASTSTAQDPEVWLQDPLFFYDPATQGYHTVGLGPTAITHDVEVDRGYWVYVHPGDTGPPRHLDMVPTYDITDYWPFDIGRELTMQRLEPFGTDCGPFSESRLVEPQSLVCGRSCFASFETVRRLGEIDPFIWWRDWYEVSEDGIRWARSDENDVIGECFDPPIWFPNRMYPGQVHEQIDPQHILTTLAGEERVTTPQGTLVCLKYESVVNGSDRHLRWVARGVGPVREMDWGDGHLYCCQEITSWSP